MYKFTIFYTCRYIHLFIFFIIINCDMSHVLEINYLILSYLILSYIKHIKVEVINSESIENFKINC